MTSLWSFLSFAVLALPMLFAAPFGEGRLGTSSVSSSRLRLQVAPRMQTSVVEPETPASLTKKGEKIVCFKMNNNASQYTLTAPNAQNSFQLKGASARNISYSVFRDNAPLNSSSSLRNTFQKSTNNICGNKGSAISIHLSQSALASAPSGTYTDTLLLYAEPI